LFLIFHSVFAVVQYQFEHISHAWIPVGVTVEQAEEGKRSVAVQDRQGQHCLTSFITHLFTITPSQQGFGQYLSLFLCYLFLNFSFEGICLMTQRC